MLQRKFIILFLLIALVIITFGLALAIKLKKATIDNSNNTPPIKQPLVAPTISQEATTIDKITSSQEKEQTYSDTNITKTESFPLIEPNLFQINIPEKFLYPPQVNKQNIQTANNDLSAQLTSYSYQADKKHYQISFVRYSPKVFQRKSKEKLLNDLQQGQVKDHKGILKKESTAYNSHNVLTRDIEIHSTQNNKPLFIRSLLVISQPYIFVISYSSESQTQLYSQNTNSYFDSFDLFHKNISTTIYVAD